MLTSGRLQFRTVPGFWIEVDWIFGDAQPDEYEVTSKLIQEAEVAEGESERHT